MSTPWWQSILCCILKTGSICTFGKWEQYCTFSVFRYRNYSDSDDDNDGLWHSLYQYIYHSSKYACLWSVQKQAELTNDFLITSGLCEDCINPIYSFTCFSKLLSELVKFMKLWSCSKSLKYSWMWVLSLWNNRHHIVVKCDPKDLKANGWLGTDAAWEGLKSVLPLTCFFDCLRGN